MQTDGQPTLRTVIINLDGLIVCLYGNTSSQQQLPMINVSLICPASRVFNSANCRHTFIIITLKSCCQDQTHWSLQLTFLWVFCSPLRCRYIFHCRKQELGRWTRPEQTVSLLARQQRISLEFSRRKKLKKKTKNPCHQPPQPPQRSRRSPAAARASSLEHLRRPSPASWLGYVTRSGPEGFPQSEFRSDLIWLLRPVPSLLDLPLNTELKALSLSPTCR